MKVAIVHDWVVAYGGAERVLGEILQMFPDADLFSVVDFMEEEHRQHLHGRSPRTTFVQRMPFARRKYRAYLPLMMMAVEQIDLSGYDLVISSSHAVAKGVITGPDQLHISYVYSPIRYAWDLQHSYLREAGLQRGLKSIWARILLHYVRIWDQRTAHGVDHFIGISHYIAGRIRKAYGRVAGVVYPPVDTERFTPGGERQDYYVTTSRLVPYKRVPLIAEAFTAMPNKKLIVIGDGPEMPALRKAAGPNVTVLGSRPHAELLHHLRSARAFLFAAEEDFGIAPIEAQACGTPVIAYSRGAALETVRGLDADAPSGVFFHEQTVDAICRAVDEFEAHERRITPQVCRDNAMRFSSQNFRNSFMAEVQAQVAKIGNAAARARLAPLQALPVQGTSGRVAPVLARSVAAQEAAVLPARR